MLTLWVGSVKATDPLGDLSPFQEWLLRLTYRLWNWWYIKVKRKESK